MCSLVVDRRVRPAKVPHDFLRNFCETPSLPYNDAMSTLSIALKEWDLVCRALLDGTQAVLLRKGGIFEANNEFELEHRRFLLFPTFIHQDPASTKPAWRERIVQVRTEPETVRLAGFGEAVRIWEVPDRPRLEQLDDLHIWDAPLLDMRFRYRPEKPLYLVLVRGWRLPREITLPNTLEYAGCKSWVPLETAVDVSGATPALSDAQIAALADRITQTFA